MNILSTFNRYIKKPKKIVRILGRYGFFNWMPDRPYLKLVYWCETGKKLNLDNPSTYNEKIQWMKLYDRNPKNKTFVDKYAVRQYISQTIGDQYLIPLLGVYNSVEEIPWNDLPNQFVLKCTHGSNSNIICSDKGSLEINEAKRKLFRWMKMNWYWFGREWVYKDLTPKIICEEYMVDESGVELKDYKIFCFNGEPKLIQVDFSRFTNHKRNLYTIDWEYIDARIKYSNDPNFKIQKPDNLNEMLDIARLLSKGIRHVRVDFYSINRKIYFGEMTFYHGSGFEKFQPDSLEKEMGEWFESRG